MRIIKLMFLTYSNWILDFVYLATAMFCFFSPFAQNGTRPKLSSDVDLERIGKDKRCDGFS